MEVTMERRDERMTTPSHGPVAHRRIRAVVASLGGTVAVVAGVGLTLIRVIKLGLSWGDVPGLILLAAGVALLVLAAVWFLGPIRRWRKLVGLPVGILWVYYVILPLTVAVYTTHVPPTAVGSRTPGDLGLPYRDVAVTTADGVRLSGWYLPSKNRAAVLMLHGSGETRSGVLQHAVRLAEQGFGVLALDARGHGRSAGTAMDWGWFGPLDAEAGVTFLAEQAEVDPGRIGAVGLSMGGEEALTAAASDARIRAVVAEGVTMRSFSDRHSVPAPMVNRLLSTPHWWLQYAAADLMTRAGQPIALEEAMRRIAPRPVLLIAGTQPEVDFNRAYVAAAPASTELWAVADVGHTRALAAHPRRWVERVTSFLEAALVG
jgi:pimeloyl-ACP methyl ester carboxylesterase